MTVTTADRLQYIMQQRNLKQVDVLKLAEPYCKTYKIKLGKSDLSQYVNGKVKPTQWKLTILGLALNVSEGWLMGLDVPMERKEAERTAPNQESSPYFYIDLEIADIILKLSPAKKSEALNYLRYLLKQEDK